MFQLRGVLQGLLNPTPRERAVTSLLYRAIGYVASIRRLNHPMHVQSIAGSARSLFEISLDIALLHQDQTNNSVERIEAFTRVERYRVAMKLVDYYANRPVPADLSINQQRAIVADPAQLVILDCYEAAGVELHLNAAIPQWADHLFFLQHAIGMALVDERLRSLGEPVRFTYLEPHEHETDR